MEHEFQRHCHRISRRITLYNVYNVHNIASKSTNTFGIQRTTKNRDKLHNDAMLTTNLK